VKAAAAVAAKTAEASNAKPDPGGDWGGLPAAVMASRCGAVNNQLTKSADAESVLTIVKEQFEILNGVNAATALHRIAAHLKKNRPDRDRVLRDERFLMLIDAAVEKAPSFNPRSVSDMLWSCATLRYFPPPMLTPLLSQVAVHLETRAFEAQHLSLIVWSLAQLECKPVRLLEQIEELTVKMLGGFNPQNCANILWGFAKLNYKPNALMAPMTAKMSEDSFLSKMKPVEVSDTAFAVAVLGCSEAHGPLLSALATRAEASTQLDRFSSRQLVMLVWSHARLGLRPPQLESWVEAIREAHERQTMLAQDKKNLEAALGRFGEDASWLRPPKEAEEEEEPQPTELELIRERLAREKEAKQGKWE